MGSFLDAAAVIKPFIYENGTYLSATFLERPNAVFTAVNNEGEVVGFAGSFGGYNAFTEYDGNFSSLHVPNSISTSPNGINDFGQIVGYDEDQNGIFHSFIANPNVSEIPEPTSFILLGVGMTLVISIRHSNYSRSPL